MTINILIFLAGMLVGSIIGFVMASMLTIGHDSDLIDRIQVQERHIRELARQLQDAQAAKIKYDELETNLTGLVDDLLSALESAEYHAGA